MPTAAALATFPKDPTKILPHLTASDAARRMERLLETIPEEMQTTLVGADSKPPRAALADESYFSTNHQVMRVEVSVDGTRVLRDAEYRQSLVDEARFAALEFLKPLVRG